MTIEIVDSYTEATSTGDGIMSSSVSWMQGLGQSFTAIETFTTLDSARWYLKNVGAPSGSMYAKVYTHSGVFGTSSIPSGAALAVSDAYEASTVPTSYTWITFSFTGANRITLTPGAKYVLTVEYSGANYIYCSYDYTTPTHSGNSCYLQGSWGEDSGDLPFTVYGDGNVRVGRRFPLWL